MTCAQTSTAPDPAATRIASAWALALAVTGWAVCGAGPAAAQTSAQPAAMISVAVHNLQPGQGQLLVGLCRQHEFLTGGCLVTAVHPVLTNPQLVQLAGAPAGEYAVQVVYDKNKNLKMDTGPYGAPAEPVGFSRDATGRRGPPAFHDASFQHDGGSLRLKIRVY
jgi:uncharacterized protein (DUF2141 family)